MSIDVERKDLDINYYLEKIVEEMLINKTKSFDDERDYKVTIKDEEGNVFKDTVTAKFTITLAQVSDTLLERAEKVGEEE